MRVCPCAVPAEGEGYRRLNYGGLQQSCRPTRRGSHCRACLFYRLDLLPGSAENTWQDIRPCFQTPAAADLFDRIEDLSMKEFWNFVVAGSMPAGPPPDPQ